MIAYRISYQALCQRVTAHKSSWLDRAAERTTAQVEQGYYQESSTIWSEIKPVFIALQFNKCAFCERQLEGVSVGLIEQDIEHFRPKGHINSWLSIDNNIVMTAPPNEGGYFKLPYHLFNYSASCKPCNSTLKRDYFPIAASYKLDGNDPAAMNDIERPYLIYPIGDIDNDPEELIQFNGISPFAANQDSHLNNRALVTIEFFKLDDRNKRKQLFKERAAIILALWGMLQSDDPQAALLIQKYQHQSSSHANCARCFVRLYHNDLNQAEIFYNGATRFFLSSS